MLREHLSAYEKAEAEKEEARRAKNQKIRKKALTIGIPATAVCAAAILIITVLVPKLKLNKAMRMIDAGEYDSAYAMLEELGNTEAIAESKYDRAMDAINAEDYDFAYAMLEELGKTEEVVANKYDRAMECIAAQDYEAAYALLEEIGNEEAIAACEYGWAMERIDAEDYEMAYALLDGLNYEDSEEKQESIKPQYYRALHMKADVGDTVFFGSYEQDNDRADGKEYIEWLVLEKKDNKLLVISQYILDNKLYNREEADVTWERCTLRKWLNESFLCAAFSEEEKVLIPTVTVPTDKNPEFDTDPGNATQDKVFLLSIAEANKYFKNNEARVCVPTAYAKANGAHISFVNTKGGAATGYWWLRSPGVEQSIAAVVLSAGDVGIGGLDVDWDGIGVRPAMWIRLED